MTDIALSQLNRAASGAKNKTLQEYVHALLARQQALDLLENIHQQINQVWGSIRRLLEGARAAQAAQVQASYRNLQKRREECIVSLHQAERRAHAALQKIVVPARAEGKRAGFRLSSRVKASRRHFKRAFSSRN